MYGAMDDTSKWLITSKVFLEAKDGVLILDGKTDPKPSGVTNDYTNNAGYDLCEVTFAPGTYTFTALDKKDYRGGDLLLRGKYTKDGTTYYWHADYEETPTGNFSYGQTITFDEETTVSFVLKLKYGAEFDNVIIRPVVVKGTEPGNYYSSFFKTDLR